MRIPFRFVLVLSMLSVLGSACGSVDPDTGTSEAPSISPSTSLTSTAAPSTSSPSAISTTVPGTSTSASSVSEGGIEELDWNDECEQALTDYLELVDYLVATYEHLPPELYLAAAARDDAYLEVAGELEAWVDELACSETRGMILAAMRIDTIEHASVFGQFIKVFHAQPFNDGRIDEIHRYVPVVTGMALPDELPSLSLWTDPTSCEEVWDRDIEIADLGAMAYALEPGIEDNDEFQTVIQGRYENIQAAEDRLGCDFYGQMRYQLEVAASRTADDFLEAFAKVNLVSGLQFLIGEAFVPALYPEAMRPDLGEPARSLLAAGTLDEVTAKTIAAPIEAPDGYLRVADLPTSDIGGVLLAIPPSHVPVALASDADYQFLARYNEGLASFAEDNRFIPDGFFSDRMIVFAAYHRDREPLDSIYIEVLRHAWSEATFEEFFEDAKRFETGAGVFFWDDIEVSADKSFSGDDAFIITYLLPVPELNVTYGLECVSSFPVRDGFHQECDEVARTLYPVGSITPKPTG